MHIISVLHRCKISITYASHPNYIRITSAPHPYHICVTSVELPSHSVTLGGMLVGWLSSHAPIPNIESFFFRKWSLDEVCHASAEAMGDVRHFLSAVVTDLQLLPVITVLERESITDLPALLRANPSHLWQVLSRCDDLSECDVRKVIEARKARIGADAHIQNVPLEHIHGIDATIASSSTSVLLV